MRKGGGGAWTFKKIDLNSTLNDVYRQQNGRNVILGKKRDRENSSYIVNINPTCLTFFSSATAAIWHITMCEKKST